MDGLQLWLKADSGTSLGGNGGVVQWADQSGNANNAVQLDENLAPDFRLVKQDLSQVTNKDFAGKTVVLLTPEEIDQAAAKAVSYSPPGS